MPKKPHPAEIRDDEIIAGAIRFDCGLFLGRGRYAKASANTLSDAFAAADRLVRDNPDSGRLPLIYAIDREGRSALVTRKASTTEEPMQNTYAKKFNAQRAAKAAGYAPEQIEIIEADGGFTWQPKKAKPANEPAAAPKSIGKRAAQEEAAKNGKLPAPPDFSAATHARFRGKLAKLVELANAGDIAGLKAVEINPVSTSPKAMIRYRDLCITALEAKAKT